MEYRSLGRSGLKVSVLSYGNMNSGFDGDNESWSFDVLQKCITSGINFIDTAEAYGFGKAESILGNNLKQGGWDRDDLIISDKLMPMLGGIHGNSRKHVRQGLHNSLKKLQLDNIDVLFLHRPDRETPLLETIRAINDMIDQDLTYYWGTSTFSAQELVEIHRLCDKHGLIAPVVEQCEYSLVARKEFEIDYAPLFDHYGMGTTIWSPLGGGLLTGRYNDGKIPDDSRIHLTGAWAPKMVEMNAKRLARCGVAGLQAMKSLADELGCTQAQLALAWTLKNPDVSTALFGARSLPQLEDNLQAIKVAKLLTTEVLEKIEGFMHTRPTPPFNWRAFAPAQPRR